MNTRKIKTVFEIYVSERESDGVIVRVEFFGGVVGWTGFRGSAYREIAVVGC